MPNVGLTLQRQVASSCETVSTPHSRFSAAYLIKTESGTFTPSVRGSSGEPWIGGFIPVISLFPLQDMSQSLARKSSDTSDLLCRNGCWLRGWVSGLCYDLNYKHLTISDTVEQKRTWIILVDGTPQMALDGPLMCICHLMCVYMCASASVCGLFRVSISMEPSQWRVLFDTSHHISTGLDW